ncbi:MAG: hypothetical protein ACD_75C00400G0008 [uncultured bacterium]|nr:MAG: hypothetical protein ACD_75C00400G0008 [uncultured bacterium]
MSAAPNHLIEINRQLRDRFSSHPAIAITPVKGAPPDQYEITYNINGLSKPGRGDIIEIAGHIIELTIPFGFPHFPPSCKPKSDTFHPDFDPAAICLGDFWNQDCQIPDLIIHIGQMINGEIYSRTNAFNEDACLWYRNHPDTFPLARITWREKEADVDTPSKTDNPSIDTLDDSDLSTDFNFLSLDDDFSQENSFPEVESAPTLDPEYLQLLESQKKYFKLRDILEDQNNPSEDLQKLSLRTGDFIRQAEELHREGRKCEKRGDARNALAAYEQAALIAADFPAIETHLERIRQTLAPLDEGDTTAKAVPEVEGRPFFDESAPPDVKAPAKPPTIDSGKSKGEPKPGAKKTFPQPPRRDRKPLLYLFGGIIAVIFAGCGYYYWTVTDKLDTADAALSQCSGLVEEGQFQDARQSCEKALAASHDIKFMHRARVEQLQRNIEQILQSERLLQGLNGKILVDGKYLPKKDAETIKTFRRLHKEAEDFFLQENWPQAIDRFTKILAITQAAHPLPADRVAEVKTNHDIAHFRMTFESAEKSVQNGKWQEAITELNKAEPFLAALPEVERQQYANRLQISLAKSTFEKTREQGDAFFAESDWQKAKATYELALSAIDTAEALPEETFDAVRKTIKRAELYELIDRGNKAFGAGAWDEAIDKYRTAEDFLADNQGLLSKVDAEPSRRKLSRIILQALIVRDRQLATSHLAKNDMKTARKVYRQLIKTIDTSSFSGESEFLETKTEVAATVQTLDEKIYLADKIQYLTDEYHLIFIDNYPTAIKENLINPIITFIRDTGDKMVFKMQCTESGSGRPLMLIMHYAFDKKSGQWELFSEQQ